MPRSEKRIPTGTVPFRPFPFFLVCLCCLAALFSLAPGARAGGDERVGYLLADGEGNILASRNIDQPLIPASTFKLLTSLEAIHHLGGHFRFKTDFFITPGNTLKIRGYGDPFLTSEVIRQLCHGLASALKKKGIATVNGIEVDNGFFDPGIEIPGTGSSANPYDASVNAVGANFNTVSFKFDKKENRYISAEPQTPLLDFAKKHIRASRLDQGRIVLPREESRIYAGRLVTYFLKTGGTAITGTVREGRVRDGDEKIYTHVSPYTLEELVQRLLQYSNNFMANQIFLTVGARASASSATLEKGITTLETYAAEILGIPGTIIAEGSGLSRKNRITPRQMLKILMAFKEHHGLMNHKGNEFYKTGTLAGIRTRAGYFADGNDGLYPFVIMVNRQGQGYAKIKSQLRAMVN
ncbi:MAG: D-alanyl-D-alanine carboxypeptidase [Desulfobacteraceae bacterium]|nr:D-alanyl-D-alanine carboxypeptidase [Desulfobacteraceae bacterium]